MQWKAQTISSTHVCSHARSHTQTLTHACTHVHMKIYVHALNSTDTTKTWLITQGVFARVWQRASLSSTGKNSQKSARYLNCCIKWLQSWPLRISTSCELTRARRNLRVRMGNKVQPLHVCVMIHVYLSLSPSLAISRSLCLCAYLEISKICTWIELQYLCMQICCVVSVSISI